LPAGAVVARLGERTTLLLAGLVDAVAMVGAALATTVWQLGLCVAVSGAAWTAFLIARQGYLIEAVPIHWRARAMSLLGGTFRVGVLVGPLIGAALIHATDIRAVFLLSGATSVAAALLALVMPDLGVESRTAQRVAGHASVVIGASRSIRASLLPLWADGIGLSASTTSLIFGAAALIDVLFFFPGGWLMDRRGRALVAVPVVLSVAVACFLLPLTSTAAGVTAVMVLIAVGNGLGSGIVMTIGADTAPETGRAQYLGGWRLCGDIGNSGGPLLVSAVAAAAPLAAACLVLGVLGLLGTGWVGYWTHRLDVSRFSSPG
jgi:MFS family permease